MSAPELKPCGRCGVKAAVIPGVCDGEFEIQHICGEALIRLRGEKSPGWRSEQKAISKWNAWNTRTDLSDAAKEAAHAAGRAQGVREAADYHEVQIVRLHEQIAENMEYIRRMNSLGRSAESVDTTANRYCKSAIDQHTLSKQGILALLDTPPPDPVAEAARVLLNSPKPAETMDVICAFIEANRSAPAHQLADGAIGAFLRALSQKEGDHG